MVLVVVVTVTKWLSRSIQMVFHPTYNFVAISSKTYRLSVIQRAFVWCSEKVCSLEVNKTFRKSKKRVPHYLNLVGYLICDLFYIGCTIRITDLGYHLNSFLCLSTTLYGRLFKGAPRVPCVCHMWFLMNNMSLPNITVKPSIFESNTPFLALKQYPFSCLKAKRY